MRYLIFGGVAYGALVLMGVALRLLGVALAAPDVALAFVLYVAFSRRGSAPAHAAFAVTLGYLCDVLGGAPRGLHAFMLATVAMVSRTAARRVHLEGFVSEALATLGGAGASLALAVLVGAALHGVRPTLTWPEAPAQILATALLGPPVFALGRRLDARLGLVSRSLRVR